jgi:hypothetical protein
MFRTDKAIRSYWVLAVAVLVASLTVIAADGSDALPVQALHELDSELVSLRKDIAEFKETHRHELRDLTSKDRTPAADQNSAQTLLAQKEKKLMRLIKKRDFVASIQARLYQSGSIETLMDENGVLERQVKSKIQPVEMKMNSLAKRCRDCRVLMVVGDREPAKVSRDVAEFHQLLQERNQLEEELDELDLHADALNEVRSIQIAKDSTERPHRLNNGKPADSLK